MPAAIRQASASIGSRSAATSAAMCPSPRCSRSVVAACQSRASGYSPRGRAALAAPSTRPGAVPTATAAASSSSAVSVSCRSGSSYVNSASACTAPVSRARNASSGVASCHTAGRARATTCGAKVKKAAITGAGPTGPSGAARPAK